MGYQLLHKNLFNYDTGDAMMKIFIVNVNDSHKNRNLISMRKSAIVLNTIFSHSLYFA